MIRLFKILSIVSLVFFLSVSTPERMAWDADTPLSWSDFKGNPDYLLDYVATTNSGMSHSYAIDGSGMFDKSSSVVYAHFYPTFSWYKPKDTTNFLLAHEQGHFDITEIHARKLRKRIQEFSFTSNSETEIKTLYNEVEQERRAMQEAYDRDTDHSRDRSEAYVWAGKIDSMLQEYRVYSDQ